MVFHTSMGTRGSARGGAPASSVRINLVSVVWATVMIVVFITAALVAQARHFDAAAAAFLNLTVSLTSAAAGVFLGERLALRG